MSGHWEIEKKYLIEMPDPAFLTRQPGCAVWEIEQIYLTGDEGVTRRIRRVVEAGETRWYRTFKRRISSMSCEEEEGQITGEEYAAYRSEADPRRRPILKTRFRVPYRSHVLEFDLYPFWEDRAVMEIELERENQPVEIPDWVRILKDVTGDSRYSNRGLAKEVPMDGR